MGTVVDMSTGRPSRSFKVVVHFERRADGGLRAWCDEVPGFLLSHLDVCAVLADVQPALETILADRLGEPIITTPLQDIRRHLEVVGVIDPLSPSIPNRVEYAALCA